MNSPVGSWVIWSNGPNNFPATLIDMYVDNVQVCSFIHPFDVCSHVLRPLNVQDSFGYIYIFIPTLIFIEDSGKGNTCFILLFIVGYCKDILDWLKRKFWKASFLKCYYMKSQSRLKFQAFSCYLVTPVGKQGTIFVTVILTPETNSQLNACKYVD